MNMHIHFISLHLVQSTMSWHEWVLGGNETRLSFDFVDMSIDVL